MFNFRHFETVELNGGGCSSFLTTSLYDGGKSFENNVGAVGLGLDIDDGPEITSDRLFEDITARLRRLNRLVIACDVLVAETKVMEYFCCINLELFFYVNLIDLM